MNDTSHPASAITSPIAQTILNDFLQLQPVSRAYLLCGVPDREKEETIRQITTQLESRDSWIVIELNPDGNLFAELNARLDERADLQEIFRKDSRDLDSSSPELGQLAQSPRMAARKKLQALSKAGKRALIVIREIRVSDDIKDFAGEYKIYAMEDFNVFLLMSGRYENAARLIDRTVKTFFYRDLRTSQKG